MKKFLLTLALVSSSIIGLSHTAQAADNSTKITFAKNSYCGSFTGNIKNGKTFRLWLTPNQEVNIRNVGGDQISIAYVNGPSGRLDVDRYGDYSSFYTDRKGNYYMRLYGTSSHSSVEFCAY